MFARWPDEFIQHCKTSSALGPADGDVLRYRLIPMHQASIQRHPRRVFPGRLHQVRIDFQRRQPIQPPVVIGESDDLLFNFHSLIFAAVGSGASGRNLPSNRVVWPNCEMCDHRDVPPVFPWCEALAGELWREAFEYRGGSAAGCKGHRPGDFAGGGKILLPLRSIRMRVAAGAASQIARATACRKQCRSNRLPFTLLAAGRRPELVVAHFGGKTLYRLSPPGIAAGTDCELSVLPATPPGRSRWPRRWPPEPHIVQTRNHGPGR